MSAAVQHFPRCADFPQGHIAAPQASGETKQDDNEQELRVQLSALQEQYQLKQLLHAQVERLSMLGKSSGDDYAAPAPSSASTSGSSILLQQQLDAANAELEHTRAVMEDLLQDHSAAVKAACEQRSGALRLLLAEQSRELRQMEQQRAAALELAAGKEEDCEAMRVALAAANTHILALTAHADQQQAPQHKLSHAHDQQGQGQGHADAHAHTVCHGIDATSSSQGARQDSLLQELQLQLSVQRQQLEVANEQVKELVQHLALKHDQADFAERRAALLEQQLDEALHRHAIATAAAPDAQRRRSCASIAEEERDDQPALSLEGAVITPHQMRSPQPAVPQQEAPQPQPQPQPEQHSKGLASSLSAALSSAVSGFSMSAKGDDLEQPAQQQTPPPLSPFALARKFVADREADAITRLKDELREREQEVAGLAAANSRLETQLEGLQTILVTRIAQSNRLAQELKDASKQLRQAEAAAASDQGALQQQLEQLSEKVVGLQDALAAGRQRETQLETQLAATRGKLAQVLDALVEDAAALQQHKPAQYKLLMQEMPAAMADVTATAAAAEAVPSRTTAASGGSSFSCEHPLSGCPASIPALRAASMPNALDACTGLGPLWLQQPIGTQQAAAAAQQPTHVQHAGLQHTSPDQPFGLRSFMRSRTLSSGDGAATASSSSGKGGACTATAGLLGDGWGRCVSVSSVEAQQPQKHALSFTSPQGAGVVAACAASSGAATPKSAAAKLLGVFRKKGREQEEGEAAPLRVPPITQSSRTTGSGEYSYVLLES